MKPDVETKKSGAHRKSKRSASVKKESDASEKPADTKKAATSSKPKAKKKAAVKREKASDKDGSASVKTSLEDAANASEMTQMKSESTAPASKKSGKSSKKIEDDVTVDAAEAQPALQMTEEDIQLTKKKYSEGINTLHTYYVRLMKAFGREQGRAIYESTKKSVQEDIKARKAQLAAQPTTTEAEEN